MQPASVSFALRGPWLSVRWLFCASKYCHLCPCPQFSVGLGTGLAFLNNLGSIVVALGGRPGGQVVFVSLFSVANAMGKRCAIRAGELYSYP